MNQFEFVPVSDILGQIQQCLTQTFQTVYLQGEVSNFVRASSGHYYFTLSDELGSLSVVLFRSYGMQFPILQTLKNGDKIYCAGTLTIYPKKGQLQLKAEYIHSSGVGVLKMRYELLKKKLASSGYFDLERKKPLPKIPRRVALITSPQGAAVHDFLNVYNQRSIHMDVLIIPAIMQGEKSASSLKAALEKAKKIPEVDVIVFTRGGGSFEDLYSFNDEELIQAIFECPICVISAIGHQVDFTLCDYVADVRAQTPTMAAEILTEYSSKILERMQDLQGALKRYAKTSLLYFSNMLRVANPSNLLLKIQKQCFLESKKLATSLHQLQNAFQLILRKKQFLLEKYEIQLSSVDPNKIFQRGVAYVVNSEEKVIRSYKEFQEDPDTNYSLKFFDGVAHVEKKSF